MGAVPGRRQYPLWALMAATAGVAILLAFRRWLETHPYDLASPTPLALPAERMLAGVAAAVGLMAVVAWRKGRLRPLLGTPDSTAWYGGVLILAAGFFRSTYYITLWGQGHYGGITFGLTFSPRLPWMLASMVDAWPMMYGAVVAAASYATAVSARPATWRWRWAAVGLFATAVASVRFVLIALGYDGIGLMTRGMALTVTGLVLVGLAGTVGCVSGDRRKVNRMDLIAALWLLTELDPRGTFYIDLTDPLDHPFLWAGPGYWLQALGTASIFLGAVVRFVGRTGEVTGAG